MFCIVHKMKTFKEILSLGHRITFVFLAFSKALLVTDDQHEAVRNQRQLELQQRQELFQWGDDPIYIHLPGYVKGKSKTLPKDIQFTQEGAEDLHNARHKVLANLGLIKLLDIFDPWDDFDDYRKVDVHCFVVYLVAIHVVCVV